MSVSAPSRALARCRGTRPASTDGAKIEPIPLDVELWWSYFDKIVDSRPFVRLGATCVLENISNSSGPLIQRLFSKADFLTPKNTVFFKIHQHDASLPHGDQILGALADANLLECHFGDLLEGARKGAVMYLRMAQWALTGMDAGGLLLS